MQTASSLFQEQNGGVLWQTPPLCPKGLYDLFGKVRL